MLICTYKLTKNSALALNTPIHGLIRPTRAVYGAANIPAVWQCIIETVIQGTPNVLNFFDDLLVFANFFDSLLIILDTVLQRLKEHGLRLNRSKCAFASSSVEFLGHKINAQGVHKSDQHIAVIRNAPKPLTPEDLEFFIGKATHLFQIWQQRLGRFGTCYLPNLSNRHQWLKRHS